MKKTKYSLIALALILALGIGATTVFAVTAAENGTEKSAKDTEDNYTYQQSATEATDINSVGVGKGCDIAELDNWYVGLQIEVEQLLADSRLTQEQADELMLVYETEIANIRADLEAGGVTALDKTDNGLEEVFYSADQLSFEPPAIDNVIENYIYKNRTLGIATNFPTN